MKTLQLCMLAAIPVLTTAASDIRQFEVASVRPSTALSQDESILAQPGGRLVAKNVTLQTLVRVGYDVSTLQIFGVPAWANSERFDILAKAGPDSEANTLRAMSPMIQGLLEARFALRCHLDTRELFVSALVPVRSGAKIKPSHEGDGTLRMTKRRLDGNRVSSDQVAKALSDVTGSLVVDQSGYEGFLDVHMTWLPYGEEPGDDTPPSLYTVLSEQFGLAIKARKTPVPIIVIDHAEKPGAN